ncbi:MAG: YqiA/YcfP family alpha/beta fold hydrolase [Acidobacteriota bacterium]
MNDTSPGNRVSPEVPSVLYLHGFASSPGGQKASAIRALLEGAVELITPDLNVPSFQKLDFLAMVEHAAAAAKGRSTRAIVGSSLGALIALELARRGAGVPLVLIAPALGVVEQWIDSIDEGDPVVIFNYAIERETTIHRAFFEQMRTVHPDATAPDVRTTIIMGRNDESVPFSRVREIWDGWCESGMLADGSRFVDIAGGDHGLHAHTGAIADEIRRAALFQG